MKIHSTRSNSPLKRVLEGIFRYKWAIGTCVALLFLIYSRTLMMKLENGAMEVQNRQDDNQREVMEVKNRHDDNQLKVHPHLASKLNSEDDPWKVTLFKRLDRIRSACGELCEINDLASFKAKSVNFDDTSKLPKINAHVDCKAIMESDDIDAADSTVPFPPPDKLLPFEWCNCI